MDLENFNIFEKTIFPFLDLENFPKKDFFFVSLPYIILGKILYNKYTRGYIRLNYSTFRIYLPTNCYGIQPSILEYCIIYLQSYQAAQKYNFILFWLRTARGAILNH